MSWNHDNLEEARDTVQRQLEKRRASGEDIVPLALPMDKKKLCSSFWGQAWCQHLATYELHAQRLSRGRSYLRQGHVYNLEISPGRVQALVTGNSVYETLITLSPLRDETWAEIVQKARAHSPSLLDILSGKLGPDLIQLFIHPETGLFPQWQEIRFICNCPDDADLCKHAAATLYAVGLRLDSQPDLLFTLRQVSASDLLHEAAQSTAGDYATSATELAGQDLSELFGISLDGGEPLR